jgi:ketosteroid isomerase-like protein
MKNILKTIIICLVFFSGSNLKAQGLVARIDSVRKIYSDALVANDTAKLFSLYTKDAISMPNYSKIAEGIEAIRKSYKEMSSMRNEKVTSYATTTYHLVTCGTIITEVGKYTINVQMNNMPQPMEDVGKYLTVWEKQKDNSLKIKMEIWNTDKFPAQDSTKMK